MIGVTKTERERILKIAALENGIHSIEILAKQLKARFEANEATLEMCYDGEYKTRLITEQHECQELITLLSGETTLIENELIEMGAPGWSST